MVALVLGARPGLFVTCLLVWTLTNMDQSLFGYAIPGILAEFRLPLQSAGTILTISFALAALLIIPAGIAADRWGRGRVLVVLLLLSAILVGLQTFVSGVVMLTVLRASGFGLSGGLSPITNALVVENASPRFRGIAMGLLQCGYPLGWFLASLLAAPLLAEFGWRAACLVAFVVVPLCLPIAWLMKRYGQFDRPALGARSQISEPGLMTGSERLAMLFSPAFRRSSLASMATFFAFGGAYAGSAFFFPTFFTLEKGYSPSAATWLVGLSNGIAILGYMAAAFVGEFLLTRRTVFAIWCVGGAFALLGLLWLSASRDQDVIWYAIMAAFFFGSQAVMAVLIAEIFPAEIRATGLAVCASAPLSLGFALFPLAVPLLVEEVGWQWALTVVVFPLLIVAGMTALTLPNRVSGLTLDGAGDFPARVGS